MAYTLANLQSDIRGYTEVSDTVLTDAVLATQIKNAENAILRAVPTDQNAHYATSTLIVGNRYVTIPEDLRSINYVQLKDTAGNQFFLEQREAGNADADAARDVGSIPQRSVHHTGWHSLSHVISSDGFYQSG